MMATRTLAFLAVLFQDVAGVAVTIHGKEGRSYTMDATVMRSERKSNQDHNQEMAVEVRSGAAAIRQKASACSGTDLCRLDFQLGAEGQCNCSETNHTLVAEEDECMAAAELAGIAVEGDSDATPAIKGNKLIFRLTTSWFHHHPAGCFKEHCSTQWQPKQVCYFFNPIGDTPAMCNTQTEKQLVPDGYCACATTEDSNKCKDTTAPEFGKCPGPTVTGQPVCSRPKFSEGAVNTNSDCPGGYGNILDETKCSRAAICLGHTPGTEIRTTFENQSEHDNFPRGCFIHSSATTDETDAAGNTVTKKMVYFNPELTNWDVPASPHGTPICAVTNTVFFDGSGNLDPAGIPDMSARAEESTNNTKTSAIMDAHDAGTTTTG